MTVVCVDMALRTAQSVAANARRALPGADVHAFAVPRDALRYIAENPCDVLITEIELFDRGQPEGTEPYGLTFVRQVQRLHPQVNVIFSTVCDRHEYSREIDRIGFSGYLTKPFPAERLDHELRHLRYTGSRSVEIGTYRLSPA